MKKMAIVLSLLSLMLLTGCNDKDADVVSKNLSTDADQFKIQRQIVFFNGITDKYLLTIEGLCSLGNNDDVKRLSVTCKVGKNEYKKHFLGLSDNVSYFVEQTEPAKSDPYHYKVIFKPETIIPNFERP